MNTSMTINADAAWMLGLYVRRRRGDRRRPLPISRARPRTTSSRSTSRAAPTRSRPEPSMRLIADMVAFTVNEVPSWNPINICSYHLQEAGATPIQEIAYAISTGVAVLDEVKARGQVADEDFPKVFGRISFFVNAGVRFVEEHREAQDDGPDLDRDRPRALRRHRREDAAVPLRRPGQLARPDRVPAREQRPAHRARSPRRDPRPRRPCPRDPAARPGTRRWASPAPGTSSGASASSRCSRSRPTSSSTPTSSKARRSWKAWSTSSRPAPRPRWPSSKRRAARSRPSRT